MKKFRFYRYHRLILCGENDSRFRFYLSSCRGAAKFKVLISMDYRSEQGLGSLASRISSYHKDDLSSLLPDSVQFYPPFEILSLDMDHATETLLCLIELWKPIGTSIRLVDRRDEKAIILWEKISVGS